MNSLFCRYRRERLLDWYEVVERICFNNAEIGGEIMGYVYWITGLSGAGKTSIGILLYEKMKRKYPNTVFLDGDALHVADLLHSLDVEQTAHGAAADLLGDVAALGLSGGDVARGGQIELADLLFEGHAAHQRVDIPLHRIVGRPSGGRSRAAERDAQQGK